MTAAPIRAKNGLWYTASLAIRRFATITFITTDNSHPVAAGLRDALVADGEPWHAS
jgi:hypothetical protein